MKPAPRLLSVLGVTFGLAAIVGNTIGAGILRTPGDIAQRLPVGWLFFGVWIAGALYALGGANAMCELATMMPRSGGQYNYSRHALGPYAGFLVGWNDWISSAGSGTAVALVFAESVTVLAPRLAGQERAVAAALIIAFTIFLLRGVRATANAQTVTSLVKALAFLVLIGAAVVYAARNGIPSGGAAAAPQGLALLAAFIIAMQSVIYAYDGWTGAIYFTEEVRDPGRDIPRATFGGLIAVAIIYLLLNAAFVAVIGLDRMAGDPLPAGTAARTIFGDNGDTIIRWILVLALPSFVNAVLPMSSRVLFAMSRDGLAPRWAERVNAGGTPHTALIASAVVALLFLVSGKVDEVIAVLSFFFVASYAMSFASVFVLRRREPNTPRPYRARGHPWTTGIVLAGSVAFLAGSAWSDPRNGFIAVALVVLSYPVYRLSQRRRT